MSMVNTIFSLVLLLIVNVSIFSLAKECYCNDIDELKQHMERKIEEVKHTCNKRYEELEQKVHKQTSRRALVGSIAFSAQLTVKLLHIPIGTTIKFNKVLVNDGPGYDNITGVFIAPEAGVYMFSYFIGNGNKVGQNWVSLMHNGQKINSAVTDTFHTNEDLQGGNMALIRMAAGDRAWIESFHASNAYLDGPNGFTSFSGIYLYA
ncbi:otolin-1-like [Ruditapes philippinarum]|uniref:otolin-1-like n=1 Tax=Ruditapes philippinarum TaxID=129788 RepID=UPI00295B305D|nr:otolin-1-like [Ruditapes philippinarum]